MILLKRAYAGNVVAELCNLLHINLGEALLICNGLHILFFELERQIYVPSSRATGVFAGKIKLWL